MFIVLNDTVDIDSIKMPAFDKRNSRTEQIRKKTQNWNIIEWKQKNLSKSAYQNNLDSLNNDSNIIYAGPFVSAQKPIAISNIIYIKCMDDTAALQLKEQCKLNNCEIVGTVPYMPKWYKVLITKHSNGNALEMANTFYESSKFEAVDPGFILEFKKSCVNDIDFDLQWGLKNNLHSNYDINACQAWTTTKGSPNIVTAIVDNGIELSHDEFEGQLFPISYDTEFDQQPSLDYGFHGTHVAGIVGAAQNNNSQISGVAPDGKLMSISEDLVIDYSAAEELATGISWAWKNGAHIINNSWGTVGGYIVNNQLLEDAIDEALTLGRNGLGTIVVFSSGNDGTIDYFSKYRPEILCVGAIDSSGKRADRPAVPPFNALNSANGTELDIMAPGDSIYTTTINNGVSYDWGTSMAAPHASGVASLILAVNPQLTRAEVVDIIESTAQKIGGYNYQTTAGRANGTWNNEMGYGLLDAAAAVTMAKNNCTSTSADLYMKDHYNDFGTEPNPSPDVVYWDSKDIWVRRQADGFDNFRHQNPEYREIIYGNPNYVYVRVRNRDCAASNGTEELKLYWAKASTSLAWPSPWDGSANTPGNPEMGNPINTQLISSIETDESTILEFEWYPPDPADYSVDPMHFCLLARIETSSASPFGMTFLEGANLWTNVRDNNNIVWRNISVIDSLTGGDLVGQPPQNPQEVACVLVKNLNTSEDIPVSLEFIIPEIEQSHPIFDYISVEVDLGEELTQRWIDGGEQGSNILYEDNVLTVLAPNAYLGNIIMTPEEVEIVCLKFQLVEDPPAGITNIFTFDMVQYDEGALVGGERFQVDLNLVEAELRKKYQSEADASSSEITQPLVYPNPTKDQFYIESNLEVRQEIELLDITGKIILQKNFLNKTAIDVKSLNNGLYLLRIKNNSQETPFIQRVVVQH